MKNSDKARIFTKINEMIRYIEELKEMLPEKGEYLENLIKRRACEKTIELAIESLIDLATMIISIEKLGIPINEENIFDILSEKKILNSQFALKLKKMKGFRNILIHRYFDIQNEIVYDYLKNYLNDFYEFEKQIKHYISKNLLNK